MIAESGWEAERDHVAIAYVLARRWHQAVKRYPHLRFIDVIRRYCSGLGYMLRHEPTKRQLWVRALSLDGFKPRGWPANASWKKHRPLWRAALKRSDNWYRGKLRDPCRGLAWHFGGKMDLDRAERRQMVRLDCGDTKSIFFGLRNDKETEYGKYKRAVESRR